MTSSEPPVASSPAAPGRVRLVDVAERAGVSMKSVSNVVRGQPHVSETLRIRVQKAIDELGYRPNVTARRLATGRTGMVALALPELDHPYFSELANAVAELAGSFGYRVLIERTAHDREAERAVIADREHGLVDGVVFNPLAMSTAELARLRGDFPLVLIGEAARPRTADHVMIDNVAAAREATAHLLSRGRRRIAFLGMVEPDPSDANQMRLDGFRLAHTDAGLHHDDALVLRCEEYSVDAGERAMRAALGEHEIDAVLCREDRFAIGAIRAVVAEGRRVPEDVAVIGWDDTHVARWATPAITSVAPDTRELARTALRLLHDRITDAYTGEGRHVLVPHRLVVRDST